MMKTVRTVSAKTKDKIKKIISYIFYIWLPVTILLCAYTQKLTETFGISIKAVHFIACFITAFVSYMYFYGFIKNRKLLSVAAVAFSCIYGVIVEFGLYLASYGTFSKDNIIFNCIGALVLGIIVIPKKPMTINGRRI